MVHRRRRRNFQICVKASAIDPFGAALQKGGKRVNGNKAAQLPESHASG